MEAAQLTMRPKTLVAPEPDAAVKLIRLVEKLEDLDDVQEVFTNVDVGRGPGRGHVVRGGEHDCDRVRPSTARLGYGVIESEPDPQAIDFGVIVTDAREPMAQRLLVIHSAVGELIDRHRPDAVAVESLFSLRT